MQVHGVEADGFADEVLELAGGDFAESGDFHAFRDLPEPEERLDQFTFATHGHLGKALEPLTVRDFGVHLDPIQEQAKLVFGNLTLPDAIEKVS